MRRPTPNHSLLLPLPEAVVLPGSAVRVVLRDELQHAAADAQELVAVPVRDPARPLGPSNLDAVGTRCRVADVLPARSGGPQGVDAPTEVLLIAESRVELADVRPSRGALFAVARRPREPRGDADSLEAAAERCREALRALLDVDPRLPQPLAERAAGLAPAKLPDRIADELPLPPPARRRLLGAVDALTRLETFEDVLRAEEAHARERVLGRASSAGEERRQHPHLDAEAVAFERRIEGSAMPEAVRRMAWRELAHFRLTAPGSRDVSRLRAWLEWVLELPWHTATSDPEDSPESFESVAESLDDSHVGLGDVKDRVIEFLAVRRLRGETGGGALCFLGPPGTGKTSMARAIAGALGREFLHLPLGGITDEAELRGYSHALPDGVPGAILAGLHRVGTRNPVVLLDEIDKLQFGSEGDTGGVLLEILDGEQSREFFDPYLGVPFDLSQCLFLATANDTELMPEALLDRLDVIDFHSFTEQEKLRIAREHLLPRAREKGGLEAAQLRISHAAMIDIVRKYTEEAGVRRFQRVLDSLARKAALSVVRKGCGLNVRKSDLLRLLGPALVDEEIALRGPRVGFTVGLAWTSVGGALLPIEALAMPGSGRTILTGSLGEVMRESVQTALSYVRCSFADFGIESDLLDSLDLHLHFPSGATPKDGPSAGAGIATSLISLFTGTPVRHDVAVSGEVSLHGAVLPVGGLREKILAAQRAGIRTVIVPGRNAEELMRLPPEVRSDIRLVLVDHVREVFAEALATTRRTRLGRLLADQARGRRLAFRSKDAVRKARSRRRRDTGSGD